MSAQRMVVCAALRSRDGAVLLGIRHYSRDMINQMIARKDGRAFEGLLDENQGFVDQHGVWMGREEAYQVALAAGQLRYPDKCGRGLAGPRLFSEALY